MRIANSTRGGGDLSGAVTFYRRAHTMAPERSEPLIALGGNLRRPRRSRGGGKSLPLGAGDRRRRLQGPTGLRQDPDLSSTGRREQTSSARRSTSILVTTGPTTALASHSTLWATMTGRQQSYVDGMEKAPDNPSLRNTWRYPWRWRKTRRGRSRSYAISPATRSAGLRVRQNLALVYGLAGQTEKAAAVASMDLKDEEVRNNLAYYQSLRKLAVGPSPRSCWASRPAVAISPRTPRPRKGRSFHSPVVEAATRATAPDTLVDFLMSSRRSKDTGGRLSPPPGTAEPLDPVTNGSANPIPL